MIIQLSIPLEIMGVKHLQPSIIQQSILFLKKSRIQIAIQNPEIL
jgi:hypothetical protein